MKKTVNITIEVDMNSTACQEWLKPADYFNESVKVALEKITDEPIKNRSGKVNTGEGQATFKVNILTTKNDTRGR